MVTPTAKPILVLIIADSGDGDRLIARLVSRGLSATKLASTGGFLRRGSSTILTGIEEQALDDVLALVQQECRARIVMTPAPDFGLFGEASMPSGPVSVRQGGATVFVLNVERFEQF